MVFSSIVFLCMFLPIVCLCYYLLPGRFRNVWLLIASLFFYAYGEPVYVGIMLFSTVFDYCNGRCIAHFIQTGKKKTCGRWILLVSIVGNLGILGFFKYWDFLMETLQAISGTHLAVLGLALPIGISFYTFQTMSYTIDVYLEKVPCQKNLLDFAMYVCLFPQLIAGPIVRYSHIQKEIRNRVVSMEQIANGLMRFSIGMGKKVLLANQLGAVYERVAVYTGTDRTMASVWLGAVAYMFQIYFDFSGYSDMAIGLGEMFGFTFPENFAHPYESKTVTEFWRRWHMTLGSWFREYVYIPLGGNRKGFKRQVLHLLIVWSLTGLWHGAGWNFVLWGLYYFVLLLLEKLVMRHWRERRTNKIMELALHVYTCLAVLFGWVLFATEDFQTLADHIRAMAGVGVHIGNRLALYDWKNVAVLLLVAGVASTAYPAKIAKKYLPEKVQMAAKPIYCTGLLFASVAFLISGSYNPFLYFRF